MMKPPINQDRDYQPRDFVRTSEGLLFAVVDQPIGDERIPCFLRYRRSACGEIQKLGTTDANALLQQDHPKYLFHCTRRDTDIHGVGSRDVVDHLRPRARVRMLSDPSYLADPFEARTRRLLNIFAKSGVPLSSWGITGSLLVGGHGAGSDIDLVLYDTAAFERARELLPMLIDTGVLTALDDAAWRDAYRRRGCALTYEEFLWHETRKYNKAVFEGTKLDISLIGEQATPPPIRCHKLGGIRLLATVTEDKHAFDYPARLGIRHDRISEVIAFTATYSGQARTGEQIEVSGLLEETSQGMQRIVVGSDREASGQYIRVISHPHISLVSQQ